MNTTKTNEDYNNDYQAIEPPISTSPPIPMPGNDIDSTIVIGAPTINHSHELKNVSVKANSITPISDADDSPIAAFDVVFSVTCSYYNGDLTSTKTYRVVKRIGIDKIKLVDEVEQTTPISIVEETSSKWKVDDKVEVKASKNDAYGEKGVIRKINSDGTVEVKFKTYTKNVKLNDLMQPRKVDESLTRLLKLAGLR